MAIYQGTNTGPISGGILGSKTSLQERAQAAYDAEKKRKQEQIREDRRFIEQGNVGLDYGTSAGLVRTGQELAKMRLQQSPGAAPTQYEKELADQARRRSLNLYNYDPSAFEVPLNLRGPEAERTRLDLAQAQATRGRQMALLDLINQSATGMGPSIAEAAGARQAEGLQRQLLAAQLGRPGVGVTRQALFAGAQAGADIAGQTAIARLQEQQDAQRALGQLLSGVRGQDFESAQAQAQLDQQRRLANLESTLQTQARQAELRSRLEEMRGRDVLALNTQPQAPKKPPFWQTALQGVLEGGATALASWGLKTSDKNAKENIQPAGSQIDRLLSEMTPQSYNYKNPADGEGQQVGVMAQDLEKSSLGKMLVRDTPEGKMVDLGKMLPLLLASQVRLNDRLNKLEG